jgi:Ca2+-binding RTX toxin-like protein
MKATIVGTPGNDVIHGTPGRDVIRGLGGNDKIFGGGGNDRICGGRGADRIHGDRSSRAVYGRVGNDRLSGGRGHDRLIGEGMTGGGSVCTNPGQSCGGDSFIGGPGDDHMTEGALVGSSRITQARLNKVRYTTSPEPIAAHVVQTGSSQGILAVTGDGNDTIEATLIQGFLGSMSDDNINITHARMWLLAGMGGDDVIVYDHASSERVYGDGGSIAASGSDTITFLEAAGVGDGIVDAGEGNDMVRGTTASAFGPVATVFGDEGDDDIERAGSQVFGGFGDDIIVAIDGRKSYLEGSYGSDAITGSDRADVLIGEAGDDILNAGGGSDVVYADDGISGNDSVDGGDGTDTCTYDQGDTVLNCP